MRLNFACLILVARDDYENILTAKISRFTVQVEYIDSAWFPVAVLENTTVIAKK